MKRDEAVALVKSHVHKENLFKHILAVEAIMCGIARELCEDEELWGLVGVLHDIDFDETMDKPEKHTIVAEEILRGKVQDEITQTIKSHNFENTKVEPTTTIAKALIAADAVSGLVVACALVMPSRKLADVTADSVAKKFKQKDFARNCSRERMLYCEKIGIEKERFFEIALKALQPVSKELGL